MLLRGSVRRDRAIRVVDRLVYAVDVLTLARLRNTINHDQHSSTMRQQLQRTLPPRADSLFFFGFFQTTDDESPDCSMRSSGSFCGAEASLLLLDELKELAEFESGVSASPASISASFPSLPSTRDFLAFGSSTSMLALALRAAAAPRLRFLNVTLDSPASAVESAKTFASESATTRADV